MQLAPLGREGARLPHGEAPILPLLVLAVVSFLAALAVFTSPWHGTPPISFFVSMWLQHLLPRLSGPSLTFAKQVDSGSTLIPILVSIIYAIPFVGVRVLRGASSAHIRRSSLAFGVILLLGTVAGAFSLGWSADVSQWAAVLVAVGTIALGLVLFQLGWKDASTWGSYGFPGRMLRMLLISAGVAMGSVILLPVGLVLLGGAYVALGICLTRQAARRGLLKRAPAG